MQKSRKFIALILVIFLAACRPFETSSRPATEVTPLTSLGDLGQLADQMNEIQDLLGRLFPGSDPNQKLLDLISQFFNQKPLAVAPTSNQTLSVVDVCFFGPAKFQQYKSANSVSAQLEMNWTGFYSDLCI